MFRIGEKFSSCFIWFIYGLYFIFIAAILVFTVVGPEVEYFPLRMFIMVVAGILAIFLLLWLYNTKLKKTVRKSFSSYSCINIISNLFVRKTDYCILFFRRFHVK